MTQPPAPPRLPGYYLAAVVPASLRGGLCLWCRTPIEGPYRLCYKCNRARTLPQARPDNIGFASYAIKGQQAAVEMYRYKDTHQPSAQALGNVWLLLNHAVRHLGCVGRLVGAGIDAVAVVPSRTHHVPGRQTPLQYLCSQTFPPGLPALALQPAPGSSSDRHVRADAFTATGTSGFSHVLVVDDTWVSGGTVLSAVATLKAAGVRHISVLALARWLDPTYGPTSTLIRNVNQAWITPQAACPFTLDGTCPK
ncbi:phosphoribosyltransferase [Actinomyces sp. 594]|uniref:phosphoribosyltransferase n=1 Tax=Actinomyces sp. 594 TaxID=2057793 RepID=UPI001C589948|nr:phosphoribosyltransferase [Actinomyces sp. 594]MBW3068970.1 phosphoribosyltransferase [Actinomyces sp. 594]